MNTKRRRRVGSGRVGVQRGVVGSNRTKPLAVAGWAAASSRKEKRRLCLHSTSIPGSPLPTFINININVENARMTYIVKSREY
uniref:Uncharacterized protein n=1 Tax=Oryza meridionalis TaxID=40149 RepID=A0A0E0C2K6_9ORYZ